MIHNPIRKALPDLSNPGAAGDLRSGKQLVGADGAIVTGTLPEVIQATPTISVSSGGLITASAAQSGGIVEGGSKSATQQLTTQGAKTVTPGTAAQTAVASGRYTTGDVDVAGDANLKAENIAEGVSIFGVTGTLVVPKVKFGTVSPSGNSELELNIGFDPDYLVVWALSGSYQAGFSYSTYESYNNTPIFVMQDGSFRAVAFEGEPWQQNIPTVTVSTSKLTTVEKDGDYWYTQSNGVITIKGAVGMPQLAQIANVTHYYLAVKE